MKSNDKKTCHFFSLIADCIWNVFSHDTHLDKEIGFFWNLVIRLDNWPPSKVRL